MTTTQELRRLLGAARCFGVRPHPDGGWAWSVEFRDGASNSIAGMDAALKQKFAALLDVAEAVRPLLENGGDYSDDPPSSMAGVLAGDYNALADAYERLRTLAALAAPQGTAMTQVSTSHAAPRPCDAQAPRKGKQ